jgi:hypothetical protein
MPGNSGRKEEDTLFAVVHKLYCDAPADLLAVDDVFPKPAKRGGIAPMCIARRHSRGRRSAFATPRTRGRTRCVSQATKRDCRGEVLVLAWGFPRQRQCKRLCVPALQHCPHRRSALIVPLSGRCGSNVTLPIDRYRVSVFHSLREMTLLLL